MVRLYRTWQRTRGFNWRFYDENFRFLRQTQPSSFPWSGIHWELWMRAQHSNIGKPQSTPGFPKSSEQSTPKGYCFKFQKGVQWVVLLSICVINVMALTRLVAVIFVPKIRTLSTSLSLPSPYPPSLNLPTPVNAERLAFLFSGYTPDLVEFLSVCFCKGFPIHYDGRRGSSDAKNLNSALENPKAVDVKLKRA